MTNHLKSNRIDFAVEESDLQPLYVDTKEVSRNVKSPGNLTLMLMERASTGVPSPIAPVSSAPQNLHEYGHDDAYYS